MESSSLAEKPLPKGPPSKEQESALPQQTYRFFPGWTMVVMSALTQFLSAPGQSYSVAAYKEPMRKSLEVSETNFSLAYAFATLISGALLPVIGRLIDRFGARRMLPTIAFFLGGACLGMSRVQGLAGLYLGFSCVRALGQGALSLVAAWLVGEWFARRRGFATALSGLGGSLSIMSTPLLLSYLIHHFGWQTGWVVMGWAIWIGLLAPGLLIVRDRPEELGLLPDGDGPLVKVLEADPQEAKKLLPDRSQWTVGEVLRDPTFWKLLAVPATSGMVGTGLVFHAVSLLGSRGVAPAWALGLISVQAIVAACMGLYIGWLTDRVQARYLLGAAMLFLSTASCIVLVMPSPWIALIYAVILGLHGSVIRSTGMVVWMDYYGREHQGSIRGIAMAVMIFAAAAGPLPLALSIDWFSTYNFALAFFIGVPLCSATLVWTAGPPRDLAVAAQSTIPRR